MFLSPPQGSPLARYFGFQGLAPPGAFGALYERPDGRFAAARRDLPHAPIAEETARMTNFPNSTNLRGARLGVSFTEGHEAVVSRASLS